MRLDFLERKGAGMIVDEELNQDLPCRGNTLAVMAQDGQKVFVLSHRIRLSEPFVCGRRLSLMLYEEPSKCNKFHLHHGSILW